MKELRKELDIMNITSSPRLILGDFNAILSLDRVYDNLVKCARDSRWFIVSLMSRFQVSKKCCSVFLVEKNK